MQELGAAERLGMEVAGFLELERRLARDRERRAAADGDQAVRRRRAASSAALQSSSAARGEPVRQPVDGRSRARSSSLQRGDQPQQCGERGDEGLGRRDAALPARPPSAARYRTAAASGLSDCVDDGDRQRARRPWPASRFRSGRRCARIGRSPGTAGPASSRRPVVDASRYWAPRPPPECRDGARSGACRRSPHGPSCRARRSPRPAAAGARSRSTSSAQRPGQRFRLPPDRLGRLAELDRHPGLAFVFMDEFPTRDV